MVPPPYDPILLREHSYYESGDLSVVLNPDTFYHNGFRSASKYGLGFLNYKFGLECEIYERSFWQMARYHVYEHFIVYFLIFMTLSLTWFSVYILAENFRSIFEWIFGNSKKRSIWKYKSLKNKEELFNYDDELEYQHVKV